MNDTNTEEPTTEEPTTEEPTTEEPTMEEPTTEEPTTEEPTMEEPTTEESTTTEAVTTEASNMKELIEYIAKSIVNSPDDVEVTLETSDEGIMLKLQVADEDKGRVIGKQGRIVQAMRTLLRVKAAKQGTRATLEIL